MTDHVLAMVYYDILIHKNSVEIIALMVEWVFQFFFFIQKHEQIKLECVTFGAFSILTARKVCVISYFLVVKTSYTPRTKGDAVEWWRTNWEVSALIDGPPSLTGGRRRAASRPARSSPCLQHTHMHTTFMKHVWEMYKPS